MSYDEHLITMSYDEHLITLAGGDGDEAARDNLLVEVTARNGRLLAVIEEQAAKIEAQEEQLTAILDLATVSARRGWRINADDIRKTLGVA